MNKSSVSKESKKMNTKKTAVVFAILAAALYAINVPFSKLMLDFAAPAVMAAFLYLGAGVGMLVYGLINSGKDKKQAEYLTKKELPYTVAMVVLDILAPILLMLGITMTNSANVVAVGNPCRVLREIGEHDREYYFKDRKFDEKL